MCGDVTRPAWLSQAPPSRNLARTRPLPVLLKWQVRTWCWRGGRRKGAARACELGLTGAWRQDSRSACLGAQSTILFFNENCSPSSTPLAALARLPVQARGCRLFQTALLSLPCVRSVGHKKDCSFPSASTHRLGSVLSLGEFC